MLRHLHIHNLAIVEEASIGFGPGLNVLSGATGAGKSIVVDSLALLGGGRARTDLIRSGEDLLTVTGVFDPVDGPVRMVLEAAGIPAGDAELVVRREVSREGRNRIFIDDRPVTLRLLSELAPYVLRIHTQREELGLASPQLQRFWVDRSGGEDAVRLLEATRGRFAAWERLAERWDRLAGDERLRLERIDLLRFQCSEIDAAGLSPGEDEELGRQRDVLRHWEAIQRALGESFERLFDAEGSAVEAVARSQKAIGAIETWESSAAEWLADLEEARIRIEEVSKSLRARLEDVPTDAGDLDAVEARLAEIDRLRRKYGDTATEILELRDGVATEREELEASEEDREALAAERDAALADYRETALELSAARREWGEGLATAIEDELADLAMGKARLRVELEQVARADSPLEIGSRRVEFGPDGVDRVSFLLRANPGEAFGPLARVASGGELARVYLALQLAAGGTMTERPTQIFDEADAGLGGSEAAALGRKLRRLADGGQILAVTHLPQVASCGHRHVRVTKSVGDDRASVSVEALDEDERLEEIARMLSGDEITEISLSNARELIAAAEVGS